MSIFGKIITVRILPHISLEIVTGNTHHPLVLPEPNQELGAEPEELRLREAIVLKDNPFLLVFKEPRYGAARRVPATEVAVAE
jgi:hypothetical protein